MAGDRYGLIEYVEEESDINATQGIMYVKHIFRIPTVNLRVNLLTEFMRDEIFEGTSLSYTKLVSIL